MPKNYLEQSVSIKRTDLAELLTKAAHFSIDNYQQLQSQCHGGNLRWDYHNAFFFAGSLASTIGYGNVYPETFGGKVFCIFFIAFGIPYFGYMMSVISELIHLNLRRVGTLRIRHRSLVPSSSNFDKSKYTMEFSTASYVIIGSAALVFLPSYGLTLIEGWSYFDSMYYSLITLTTVGIGDFVPSILPPNKFATYVRNDTKCFEALVDPIDSSSKSIDTGMPIACNQTEWTEAVQLSYSWYRVLVFIWILIGLAWLGGIIQMISDNFRFKASNPEVVLKRF
ncbi:Oidioi.mRNA.OKI2018_I69.XSR.g14531.t1.cds [Oikopleura dioica]|uniref:Oidioi.mRNA.OKI2018_I69.XSR.g14531.t1.cds n=1 Tax=Oikopleura dioica TaxID=34765 RepID=A0ABN7SFB4_OIKDI|nr:Oidioi.mRNA.OKI2018_I69.XSR.g14531.t1.cds [Oikopleura dioica]